MNFNYYKDFAEGSDTIYTIGSAKLKVGKGSLREVGFDAKYLGMSRVAIFTDAKLGSLAIFDQITNSLKEHNLDYVVYDEVLAEPTDESFKKAIEFASNESIDGFISFGGGSVIDTAKAANLYSCYPNDLLAYVDAPIGRGEVVPGPLKPHIACVTTFGTASESTPISVFDYLPLKAKTRIMHPTLRPSIGILDPSSLYSLPQNVIAANGFDVFSHACESYTARPFNKRSAPSEPNKRPETQGANPYGDFACLEAIRIVGNELVATTNTKDQEEREQGLDKLMLAGTLAGVGFSNSGCHIPHGMSYAVSGLVRDYRMEGWDNEAALIPHGLSVILNAPAVFKNFSKYCPERHLEAVKAIYGDNDNDEVERVTLENAGDKLADKIINMLKETNFPNGLGAVGYEENDLEALTNSASLQKRLLANSPKLSPVTKDEVRNLFEQSFKFW